MTGLTADSGAKRLARAILGAGREAVFWPRHVSALRGRPRLVLFPARGRTQSSLLRIYNLSEGLAALGWSTVIVPWTFSLAQRWRILTVLKPDVLLMQGVRHHLNRPSLYPGQTIAFDMDDADFHLPHLEPPLRDALPDVSVVLAGSAYVADWCAANGASETRIVWTGTPISAAPRPPHMARGKVVAWAQAKPDSYALERAWVQEVVTDLARRQPDMTLRLYGRSPTSDECLLASFRAAGIAVDWRAEMPYDAYLASFDDVALGLSPICPETPFSRGKSFGKVLAYLDRNVPVIASDEADHSAFFTPDSGVISNDKSVWVAQADALLSSAEKRQTMADAAFAAFQDRLSVSAVATRVDKILREVAEF